MECAQLGADRDLIVTGLGINAAQLADAEVVDRLRATIEQGAALFRLELLDDLRVLRKLGKVNAVLAALRHALGWDRRDSGPRSDSRPDDEAAFAELERLLRGAAGGRRPEA